MNAPDLYREVLALGVRLSANGDKLRAEGATEVLTAELRESITKAKPELLALVADPESVRDNLLSLAVAEGVPKRLPLDLDAGNLLACIGLPDGELRGFLRGLARHERMAKGECPPGWETASECSGCGPVWLDMAAPAYVVACPWCWHRKRGTKLPRPSVACEGCKHYQPDPINPEGGMGACGADAERWRWHWPGQLHPCADHSPIDNKAKQ